MSFGHVGDPNRTAIEKAEEPVFTQDHVDYLRRVFDVKAPVSLVTDVNAVVLLISASGRSYGHDEIINHLQQLVLKQHGEKS